MEAKKKMNCVISTDLHDPQKRVQASLHCEWRLVVFRKFVFNGRVSVCVFMSCCVGL